MRKIKIAAHSEKVYIQRRGNSLLRPKRKEAQERKTRSQERSTRKKHRTTYNTKQNLTTKNNTYRLQRGKNISSGKENAHLYTNSIQQERYNTQGYSVISSPGVKFNHRPHSILSTQDKTRKTVRIHIPGQSASRKRIYIQRKGNSHCRPPLAQYPAF